MARTSRRRSPEREEDAPRDKTPRARVKGERNSAETQEAKEPSIRRDQNGRWLKGSVPNPEGRLVGQLNRGSAEIKEFCRQQLSDPGYLELAIMRVRSGTAPELEKLWYYYAYGQPRPLAGDERPPIVLMLTRPIGYDPLAAKVQALEAQREEASD